MAAMQPNLDSRSRPWRRGARARCARTQFLDPHAPRMGRRPVGPRPPAHRRRSLAECRFPDSTFVGRNRLAGASRRFAPMTAEGTAVCGPADGRTDAGAQAMYCLVAALAAALTAWSFAETGWSVQITNQRISGVALTLLAAGAGLGLCRVSAIRDACALIAAWATCSPFFLPGRLSCVHLVVGLAVFLAAGWAAETHAPTRRSEHAHAAPR